MARMHSRRRGKAGSKRPLESSSKNWCTYSPKEIETLILKLAKAGKKVPHIGLALRDAYGVPSVKSITGKKIGQIMKENNVAPEIPDDLFYLIKKDIEIMKHLETYRQDKASGRALILNESKINRLVKYYKRNKVLDQNWAYDRSKAKLIVG